MKYLAGDFDIIVIGLVMQVVKQDLLQPRMGCKTLMCTMNLESVAFMPCNPNIGGTAKRTFS